MCLSYTFLATRRGRPKLNCLKLGELGLLGGRRILLNRYRSHEFARSGRIGSNVVHNSFMRHLFGRPRVGHQSLRGVLVGDHSAFWSAPRPRRSCPSATAAATNQMLDTKKAQICDPQARSGVADRPDHPPPYGASCFPTDTIAARRPASCSRCYNNPRSAVIAPVLLPLYPAGPHQCPLGE
jgi:hypothetical protein